MFPGQDHNLHDRPGRFPSSLIAPSWSMHLCSELLSGDLIKWVIIAHHHFHCDPEKYSKFALILCADKLKIGVSCLSLT